MKKWIYTLGFSALLLTACNNADQDKVGGSQSEKREQENQVEEKNMLNLETLTLEQAMQIDENNYYNFVDSFFTTDSYYGDEYMELDGTRQDLIKRFHAFATDQFFTDEFIQSVNNSCNACDVPLPFPTEISDTINPKFSIDSPTEFTLTGLIPLDIYTDEGMLSKTFVLEDEQWKLKNNTFKVTKQADGLSSDTEKYYKETVHSNKAKQFEQLVSQLQEKYNEIERNSIDYSQADLSNAKYDVLLDVQDVITEMEAIIVQHDEYYKTNKAIWDNDVKTAVAKVEQETMGGSGQGLIMTRVEVEMQLYRAQRILSRYIEVF